MSVLPLQRPGLKALVYVQQFVGECMPIYPLYALMFAERSGLSSSEISLLFSGWVVIAMLAEVPTGIIADKFSRKWALIFSYLLQGLAFLAWMAFPSFWGYALGFLVWGIGYAFSSGTFEAYLYEELKTQGQSKIFNKVFARSQSVALIGMVIAYLVASVIGAKSYTLALVLSAALSFCAAGLTLLFPYKSKDSRSEQTAESYIGTLKTAITEVRHNKKARSYVLAVAILMGVVGTMEEYTPLFYNQVGFATESVPLILAVGLLLSSLMGWFAHRLERLRFAAVALLVVVSGVFLYAGTYGKLLGLFGVIVFMRLIMLAETLFSATLQHHIQDSRRATIGSLASFGGEVLSFCILGAAGLLFATSGNMPTYRILAVLFIVFGLGLVVLGYRKHLRVDALVEGDGVSVPGRPV
jgi:predicted MFS family arabinose efflux permease